MFGERLKQARLVRGMSQQELANTCGVSKMAISYYENDKDFPGSDVLLKITDALQVQLDYFYRTVTVKLGAPAYRKDCHLCESDLVKIEAKVRDHVERYLETEALFLENPTSQLRVPDTVKQKVDSLEDVETRADCVRSYWGLAHYPIDNLTELLEENGIRVIYVDAADGFDGCAYPDGDYPVIIVNGNKCGDRIRFDLAHELGHLLMTFPESWAEDRREKAAHRFAGAFLVPAPAVRRELGDRRITIMPRELHDLKHKYGMSMGAWIYRASDLKIVNTKTKSDLYTWLKKNSGPDKDEPGISYPRESTNRHVRLVARAYADRIISQSRAAELLSSKIDELDKHFTDSVIDKTTAHCVKD